MYECATTLLLDSVSELSSNIGYVNLLLSLSPMTFASRFCHRCRTHCTYGTTAVPERLFFAIIALLLSASLLPASLLQITPGKKVELVPRSVFCVRKYKTKDVDSQRINRGVNSFVNLKIYSRY